MSFITNSTLRKIKEKSEKLNGKSSQEFSDGLQIILYKEKNLFVKFSTEKKWSAIYRQQCSYKDPIKFTVALIDDTRNETQVAVKAVHVSLAEQLKIFLQIPGLFHEIQKYERKINKIFKENGRYCSAIHGNLRQNTYLPNLQVASFSQFFCCLTILNTEMS